MDDVVWDQYRKRYCDSNRVQQSPLNLNKFRKTLLAFHPASATDILDSLIRFDIEVCELLCEPFVFDDNQGRFVNAVGVRAKLRELRPDLTAAQVNETVQRIEKQKMSAKKPNTRSQVAQKEPSVVQPISVEDWVRAEYRARYCNQSGRLDGKVNLDAFRDALTRERPNHGQAIKESLKKLNIDICEDICRDFDTNNQGQFNDAPTVLNKLVKARPDLQKSVAQKFMSQILKERQAASTIPVQTVSSPTSGAPASPQPNTNESTSKALGAPGKDALRSWIQRKYLDEGFQAQGFVGWKAFEAALVKAKPEFTKEIKAMLKIVRQPGHAFSLEHPDDVTRARAAKSNPEGGVKLPKLPQAAQQLVTNEAHEMKPSMMRPNPDSGIDTLGSTYLAVPKGALPVAPPTAAKFGSALMDNLVLSQLKSLTLSDESTNASGIDAGSEFSSDDEFFYEPNEDYDGPDFDLIGQLITDKNEATSSKSTTDSIQRDIGHAPLLSDSIVAEHTNDLVPQYGFLGCEDLDGQATKIFQNTNVPFSTFICGVQGSGKSHTTACMLENALIPSPHLGRLQAPVSALVFSYGEFSNGGAGFTVSEAAYLAAANKALATQRVKKVTVLTSPSNPAIKKFYKAIPGIEVLPFKLKSKSLDIGTLLTLMAVNEKSEVPLYMAKVESILRNIATESEEGVFDYDLFKERLALESFLPTQLNMLEMRLGLLESFLDKEGNVPEPKFRPGEVTIIDLSDPFVSPNTACILFKLCLERFMQSRAPGKMVVLDEAHKYMLDTPGSKLLTNYLATLIRLQRHKGARVIISTQEPTVSTDLIALCSVTVIHRFTSPAWFDALKKHINAMHNTEDAMRQIESLETGEALVYSPNAVLGKLEDGSLIKAPGRLLRMNIRKRVTRDGGESIMAI